MSAPGRASASRGLALAGALAGAVACSPGPSHPRVGAGADGGTAVAPQPRAVEAGADLGGASPSPSPAAASDASAKTRQPPVTRASDDAAPVDLVTIHVLVEPPQRAHVIWGAKDFGLGPLDIRRPRGSGPLDLLVRAPGYLTLHTRAFTDRDNTLSIHLVPEAEATRFPGYQAPSPTVTARGPAAPATQRSTTRAMRGGKPSDGARAP